MSKISHAWKYNFSQDFQATSCGDPYVKSCSVEIRRGFPRSIIFNPPATNQVREIIGSGR